MFSSLRRRMVALLAAVTVGATLVAVTPAAAADQRPSRISVFSSDYKVESGEEFVLRGRMLSMGKAVAGATVRVKTLRNGTWQQLTGAVVQTRSDGRYRVRIVLGQTGLRDLRVVGDPKGDRIRIARDSLQVRVVS